MGKIVVDRGLEEYTIEDKNGNVLGTFEMNPSDLELIKRYEEVAEKMAHISEGINQDDLIGSLIEMEKKINDLIDYLFNAKVAEKFFSITSPFTMLASGEFFIENVINAIGGLIESETGKKYEKIQAKISKYTEKYNG